jgi:hypothetical protein
LAAALDASGLLKDEKFEEKHPRAGRGQRRLVCTKAIAADVLKVAEAAGRRYQSAALRADSWEAR